MRKKRAKKPNKINAVLKAWRPRRESNPRTRICNPLRNHSATWPPWGRLHKRARRYRQEGRRRKDPPLVCLGCGTVVSRRGARPPLGHHPVWEQGSPPLGLQPEQLLGPTTSPHDMDRSLTMPQIIVGCDLSRAFIDVCINAGRTTSRIENIKPAIAQWLETLEPSALVVFEATSGCDGLLMEALDERDIAYARVNPRQAREFAPRTRRFLPRRTRSTPASWPRWGSACRSPSPRHKSPTESVSLIFSGAANSWSRLARPKSCADTALASRNCCATLKA